MVNYDVQLAKIALKIGAIKLNPDNPFKWASGYFMPIYNDNRLLLGNAKHRAIVAEGFLHTILTKNLEFDVIGGTSTSGIPPGETLADKMGLPFFYVRDKPKEHGMRNRIEGVPAEEGLDHKIALIVEDLVSTGGSSIKAAQGARDAGATVNDMVAIFSYGLEEAAKQFVDADIRLHPLLTYSTLLHVAKKEGYLTQSQVKMLEEWRAAPFEWGEKHGFGKQEQKSFAEKWKDTVYRRNSVLCVGIDPAEPGQRPDLTLRNGEDKLAWALRLVNAVAPHAAAIKPNRNYIKDFSREDTQRLVKEIHRFGMLAIDDSKLADIGDTNDAGFYHAQQEGFDAVTYAPFPGNLREGIGQAHARGLGIIPLVLMSNPEFKTMKNLQVRGLSLSEYLAFQCGEYGADAMVIGAPSPTNHIKENEVRRLHQLAGDTLVLMPGVGAQGGDAKQIMSIFGGSNVIANVGRAIMGAHNPERAARTYQDMLNAFR